MGEEIGIKIEVFRANIKKLRSSLSRLDSGIPKNRSFHRTNITPFTDDLENTIKAIELLIRYKSLLDADIRSLEDIGERIWETDERLAKNANNNRHHMSGPQPISH